MASPLGPQHPRLQGEVAEPDSTAPPRPSAAVPVGGSGQLSPSAGPHQVPASVGANRLPVPRLSPIVCQAGRAGHCHRASWHVTSLPPAPHARRRQSSQASVEPGEHGASQLLHSARCASSPVPTRPHAMRQAVRELGLVAGSCPRGKDTPDVTRGHKARGREVRGDGQ